MEERQGPQNHKLSMSNRSNIEITGVNDVISFDSNEIILDTESGLLLLRGEELHISHLTLEKGEVHVDGHVDSLTYSEANKTSKQAEKFFGRLFK